MAAQVGVRRMLESLRKGSAQANGCEDTWTPHIEGACGEMVVAKALNRYWSGSVNTYSQPDVAEYQVRTRSKPEYQLIVRPDDDDEAPFVLVRGRAPSYDIVGWLYGYEAKQSIWLRTYGNRRPAYFVPDEALHDPSQLSQMSRLRRKHAGMAPQEVIG